MRGTADLETLDAYRRKPGGGSACHICGHRFVRHESSTACLRAALLAIADALESPVSPCAVTEGGHIDPCECVCPHGVNPPKQCTKCAGETF